MQARKGKFFAFTASLFKKLLSKKTLSAERIWPSLVNSSRIVIKGSLFCFEADRLFESEANYQIKESRENPLTQLINPHLLTETVVRPSQHVS